jgi:recombination protein RecT
MSENQPAVRPTSVKDLLALPAYKDRFSEVLRNRAPQFMAAITAVSQTPGLKDAEPRSVIAAAMVAATLDLPVNPTLGQAHIVAYNEGERGKVAQFQIGYKGLIQLALRSGQYKRLNAGPVNGSVFKGYDMVGEPVLDWSNFDPTGETTGYFCAFETLNGFVKIVYWSKAQAEAHAKRFSRAYQKGWNSPWKTDFDAMATKTVVKAALAKWGILSVEMQKAVVHDQGAQEDVDADVKYVDGEDTSVQPEPAVARPAPPKRAPKGAAAVKENVEAPAPEPKNVTPVVEAVSPQAKPTEVVVEAAPAPAPVETFEQAAPATEEAAPAKQPRAFLQDGERVKVDCKVEELTGLSIPVDGKPTPSVKAKLSGEFVGEVYHLGGGGADGQPSKPWAVGAVLTLELLGKKNKKGTVSVTVEAVAEKEEF